MYCPCAFSCILPNGPCLWSSLALSLRSVYPRSQNRVAPRTSRSVTEDKCEDDLKAMVAAENGRVIALHSAPGCTRFQWQTCKSHQRLKKKGIALAVFGVATCCGSPRMRNDWTLWQHLDRLLCWTCRGVSLWHVTTVVVGSTSQYVSLTSDDVRLNP